MNKVIFEDSAKPSSMYNKNQGFIMSFLIKKGIVKTDTSANILMIIVSVIFLSLAISVIYFNFFNSGTPATKGFTFPIPTKN